MGVGNGSSTPDVRAIAERLRAAGIGDAPALAALAAPSVRIAARRAPAAPLTPGASRFGGSPDVPPGLAWPSRRGRPLTFLAQIDLSMAGAPGLPESGWLLFFYDAVEQPWGFDPHDAGGASVVHVAAAREALRRIPHPPVDRAGGPFEPCALSFTAAVDLPDPWDHIVQEGASGIGTDQLEAYHAAADALSGVEEGTPHHHLVGHPQLVQDDMRGECQLVTSGIQCGDATGYQGQRAKDLLRAAGEWTLLLQLDSDEQGPGWMWGDSGRIYYWMRRSDLAARAFERAWLVLQCG